jgi:NTP pyrophosphatase (non-canonical NTP hydrolase)
MTDKKTTILDLKKKIREFIAQRKWEKAHSPKNLAMSIAIETAELMEHFQWITEEQSRKKFSAKQLKEIEDELADVAIYLIDLCDVLRVDLSKAIKEKMVKNSKKYPVGSNL